MLGPTSSTLLRGSRVNNLFASRCLGLKFASRSNINGRPMQETGVSSPLQLRSFRECSLTRCNRSSSCRTLLAAGRYNETLIAQAHLQQPESTSAIVGYEVVEELGGSGGRREKLVGTVVDVLLEKDDVPQPLLKVLGVPTKIKDGPDVPAPEHLIPYVKSIVPRIDNERRVVIVNLPAGLLQLGLKTSILHHLKKELDMFVASRKSLKPPPIAAAPKMPTQKALEEAGRHDLVRMIVSVGGFLDVAQTLGFRAARRPAGYWDDETALDRELSLFVAANWVRFDLTNQEIEYEGIDETSRDSKELSQPVASRQYYWYNQVTHRVRWSEPILPETVPLDDEGSVLLTDSYEDRAMPSRSALLAAGRYDLHSAIVNCGGYAAVAEDLERWPAWPPTRHLQDFKSFASEVKEFCLEHNLPQRKLPSASEFQCYGRPDLHQATLRHGGYSKVAHKLRWKTHRRPAGAWKDLPAAAAGVRRFAEQVAAQNGLHEPQMPTHEELRAAGRHDLRHLLQKHGSAVVAAAAGLPPLKRSGKGCRLVSQQGTSPGSMEEQPLVGVGLSRFGSFRNLSETGFTLEMEPETHKIPNLLNLGDALATILLMVPLEQRLAVAGTCRALRDFVYRHSELWPNITASGALGNGISGPLNWAAERRHVRRLRVTLSGLPTTQNCEETVKSLARAVHNLQELVSLQVTMDVGLVPMDPIETIFPLLGAPLKLPRTLKQLTLAAPSLHLPSSMSELTALTALSLRSVDSSRMGDGVTFAPDSLPRGLLILEIGSLGQTHLPEALKSVEALQSLTVDWAWEGTDAAVAPELSLLEESSSGDTGRRSWCDHLTHLGLGYFEAKALPKALPPSLKSLDLQWNLTTTESCCRKASVDVDTFHASFSCLQPLTALKHLCLNNALGGWGLPDAVTRLTQLESLGVAGTSPLWHWEGRRADIAPQLSANFPNLKSLDIEIYEAAAGWEHIAKCSKLERLRLGKSAAAEAYVRSDVRAVVGRGLVRLLPALPALKEVHTEGMLLPATSACRRWERLLLGFEADSVRAEAAAAVDGLYRRCVALYRWYSWPFWPGTANHSDKFCPWDEVPIN